MESTLGGRIRAVRRARLNARGRPTTLAEFGRLVAAAEREITGGEGQTAPYPHSTVSRWETDRRRPSDQTLAAIAAVGRIPFERLVHGDPVREHRRLGPTQPEDAPPPTPGVGMTPRLTVWREAFRLELARAGASVAEIEAVSGWLARPVWARAGGSPTLGLSDDEMLELWARMADIARWCLARRGRGFRLEREPAKESLVPKCPPGTPPWAATREVELRAFRWPAILEALFAIAERFPPAAQPGVGEEESLRRTSTHGQS